VKTLILWLDAFRKDYISEERTPYLHSLIEEFNNGDLKPVLGYNSIGASFFTGSYPEKHDQFTIYCYDEKPNDLWFLKFIPNRLRSYFLNSYRYLFQGNDFFVPSISWKYYKYFTISQSRYYHHDHALKTKTIFNIFRENHVRFLVYNWPLTITDKCSKLSLLTKPNDRDRTNKFLELCKKNYDAYFLHLWDLDKYGHMFGPNSKKLRKKIKEEDEFVKKILSNFSLDEDNILIWSDHGMLPVKKTLDLKSLLPKFGDGYLYFLDSAMARFWFFDQNKRKKVIEILHKIKDGYLLSKQQIRDYKIDFQDNKYGDEIFLVNPGVLIMPNFFQEKPIKGMHGYDLSDKGEWGFFIINKKSKEEGVIIDLFPTILELMNIEIENETDGKSLLLD
jgi:predicted AlkP superfamily pyrophosphatase or phosphodiesterase